MGLPILDLAACSRPGEDIDLGFGQFGFLRIRNCGVTMSDLDAAFEASEAFFTGHDAFKRRCAYRSAAENFGYQGVGEENLDPDAPADLKETFTMRNILAAPPPEERWPSPQFRETMRSFYARALAAAHAMQREMARVLGHDDEAFVSVHSGETVTLRLLRYPALSEGGETSQMGAGAHSDYGFMTLLFQRGVAGLEVRGPDAAAGDGWIAVPPDPDVAVVNSGDLLERWTNGRYRSTLHRVLPNRGTWDRYSIAMFVDPDPATRVEVLPSCITPASPARWEPITASAHLQARLGASHKGRFVA